MTCTANKVIVTPQKAKQWLETSKGNRHINKARVAQYKHEMIKGNWRYNGDRIRFLGDGSLYDGHHRLTACVESNCQIIVDTFVIPDEAKFTVDKGNPRKTADNLAMEYGVKPQQSAAIATAVRMMVLHDQSQLGDWARGAGGESYSKMLTENNLQKYYLDNRENINEASEWAHQHIKKQNTLITKSHCIAFLCLASRFYGKDQSYSFLKTVLTGYGIEPYSTADHIRNALIAVKMGQRKMAGSHKLYSVIKGFKSLMAGRRIKHPHNATFKPSSESFPRFGVVYEK